MINNESEATNSLKTVSILATNYDLGEFGSLTNNLILSNLGDSANFKGALTLAYGFNLTDSLSSFIEYYANQSEEVWNGAWDTGLGYLVNEDLLLDLSLGYDLSRDVDSSFVSVGFSYRF
ncbi:MAG: hypothetical protein CME65_03160 [Halobacteriovoraceae bacterium]|nr:hypothetical protein [Halobacteriovoraceae bacterium]